jgi:alpha-glucosidase/alpha-D-xyloside xylohydrolase
VRRGDLYLWGRDILVAPVVEKGATQREVYLPAGRWHDFWTGAVLEGGRLIRRDVDLATLPLFVRAGAIVPTGPIRQRTDETSDEPVLLTVYPGVDGAATLYEDDGTSFAWRDGAWRKFLLTWHDAAGRLEIALVPGSQPLAAPRSFAVCRAGATPSTRLFDGTPLAVTL